MLLYDERCFVNFLKKNRSNIKWIDLGDNPIRPCLFAKDFSYAAFPNACVETSLPDEIIGGRLYIGSESCARNAAALESLGVTHVLSVCHFGFGKIPISCQHLVFPVNDALSTNLLEIFDEAIDFIEKSSVCLVHCSAGVSRSATICIAFMMHRYG